MSEETEWNYIPETRVDPSTFNPWKSNKDQTPECKLDLVRRAARELISLVDELRQPFNNSARSDLYWKATRFLNKLEEEGYMEFINEDDN